MNNQTRGYKNMKKSMCIIKTLKKKSLNSNHPQQGEQICGTYTITTKKIDVL